MPKSKTPIRTKGYRRASPLLILSEPDTRPMTEWSIQCDLMDCSKHQFIELMNRDPEMQAWLALGMNYKIDPDGKMAHFETRDPATAAAMTDQHGWLWFRREFDVPDTDTIPAEGEGFQVDGPDAAARYKLHLVFVAPFADKTSDRLVKIIEKYGFTRCVFVVGPIMSGQIKKDVRQQIWFTTDKLLDPAQEQKLRAALIEITPNICLIEEINRHDFCPQARYPGHRGYDYSAHYITSGFGFFVSDDDGGEEDEGEPLLERKIA